MPDAFVVGTADILGVNTVELMHALGKIAIRCFQHKMVVMIGYLAISMAASDQVKL